MEQLLDGSAGQPPTIVDLAVVQEHRSPRHEPNRRVEIAPDPFRRQLDVPTIDRVIHFETVRAGVTAQALPARCQAPNTRQEVLVAPETRRRVREVAAGQPAPRAAERVTHGGDSTDP
jgi:hypothetical protein